MKKKRFSKERVGEVSFSNESKTKFFNIKNTGLLVGLFIVVLMIFSIFAVSVSDDESNSNKLEYNGFGFINKEGLWYLEGSPYGFEYSPQEAELVNATVDLKQETLTGKVYLVFDPSEFSMNSLELVRLKQFLVSRRNTVSFACIKEEGCGDIPILNCDSLGNLVYIKNSNVTEISKESNCITLNAVNGQEGLVINRFMYDLLDVI